MPGHRPDTGCSAIVLSIASRQIIENTSIQRLQPDAHRIFNQSVVVNVCRSTDKQTCTGAATVKPHHLIVSEHMDGLRIASCDANRIHWIASQFALQSETVKNDNRTFWLFLNSNRTGVINPVIAESNRSPLTAQRYVRRPEDHGPPLGG